jgi:hypothetical protein
VWNGLLKERNGDEKSVFTQHAKMIDRSEAQKRTELQSMHTLRSKALFLTFFSQYKQSKQLGS